MKFTNQGIELDKAQDLRVKGFSVVLNRKGSVVCCSKDAEELGKAMESGRTPILNRMLKPLRKVSGKEFYASSRNLPDWMAFPSANGHGIKGDLEQDIF